jgi:hypothetical protein
MNFTQLMIFMEMLHIQVVININNPVRLYPVASWVTWIVQNLQMLGPAYSHTVKGKKVKLKLSLCLN